MMKTIPPADLMAVVGIHSPDQWDSAVRAGITGFKYFSGSISSKAKVLEVGCGCGRLAVSLIGKVKHYTGIEVYEPHVLWCQENLKPASFFYYDINNEMYNSSGSQIKISWPDIKNKSQDVVYLAFVLTHMRTQQVMETFEEIKRVLKTRGKLIFSCYVKESAKDGTNTRPAHAAGAINNKLDEVSWGDSLTNNTYVVYNNKWIQAQLSNRGFTLLKMAVGNWGGGCPEPIEGLTDRYQDWFCYEIV